MTSKIKTKSPKFPNFFTHAVCFKWRLWDVTQFCWGNKMPFYFYCCIFLCAKFGSLNFEQTLEHHMLAVLRSKKPNALLSSSCKIGFWKYRRKTHQIQFHQIQCRNSFFWNDFSNRLFTYKRENQNLLIASEEVSVSCYCVEERSVDLVFGKASAQVLQALWGILLHFGLTENPVPVTWRGWWGWKERKRKNKRVRSENSVNTATPVANLIFNHLPLKKTNFPSSLS